MFWASCSLLIRSGLILAVAELLRRSSHRWAARDRHRIVLAAFALLFIWPLFSSVLPEISIPLWIYRPNDGMVTVRQTASYLQNGPPRGLAVNWPLAIWFGGVLLALTPVAAGYVNLYRLVRHAVAFHDRCWQASLSEECSRLQIFYRPTLLICDGPVMPFTFGLWRSRILLPSECLHWTPLRRRAVLLHELAHIRRLDLAWQLFANLIAALWWFQPLCWWNRWSLRHESEQACDALVLHSGVLPSEYARELLEIAQGFRMGQRWSTGAIAMARHGELEVRLRSILGPPTRRTGKRPFAGVAVLTALTVAASAITIFPEQSSLAGGYNMKRTLMSGLLISAGLSAATMGGSAVAPHSAAFSHPMGPKAVGREAAVEDTRAADTQQSAPKLIRVGGNVAEANLIKKVQPVYPASAKSAGVQGAVVLDVTISKEGVPQDISVVSSPSDDLAQSALEAVRQWRYRPTLLNGQPVAIITKVMVNYTLSS